jgi:hypothetical protein
MTQAGWGSPACAGMHPSERLASRPPSWFPCARGDTPVYRSAWFLPALVDSSALALSLAIQFFSFLLARMHQIPGSTSPSIRRFIHARGCILQVQSPGPPHEDSSSYALMPLGAPRPRRRPHGFLPMHGDAPFLIVVAKPAPQIPPHARMHLSSCFLRVPPRARGCTPPHLLHLPESSGSPARGDAPLACALHLAEHKVPPRGDAPRAPAAP